MIGAGALSAQASQRNPVVRSIVLEAVPTSSTGLPAIDIAAVAAAWRDRHVNLSLERELDTASIAGAKEVLRELYAGRGIAIRVEHSVRQMPPRSVEVTFRMIELCKCD